MARPRDFLPAFVVLSAVVIASSIPGSGTAQAESPQAADLELLDTTQDAPPATWRLILLHGEGPLIAAEDMTRDACIRAGNVFDDVVPRVVCVDPVTGDTIVL